MVSFAHPESIGKAGVRRGVRDDGSERLEVEPVRGEREPETEQHPTGCKALQGRVPGSRDPADRRGAAHAPQVEPPGESADGTRTKDAVAMEEEAHDRSREAERAWREAIALGLSCGLAHVRPTFNLLAAVVLVEVGDHRVGVQREDPVDEHRVAREARLVPDFSGDCGEFGKRPLVDRPSVERKTRSATALEQRRREAGWEPHGDVAEGERPAAARPRRSRATERAALSRRSGHARRRRRRAPRGRRPATLSRSDPRGPRRGAVARAARRARPSPARAASRAMAGCCAATAPNGHHRRFLARFRECRLQPAPPSRSRQRWASLLRSTCLASYPGSHRTRAANRPDAAIRSSVCDWTSRCRWCSRQTSSSAVGFETRARAGLDGQVHEMDSFSSRVGWRRHAVSSR